MALQLQGWLTLAELENFHSYISQFAKFQSVIFHPCDFVCHFPVLQFPVLQIQLSLASWQQSEKIEHRCTITNHPLSSGIKMVPVVQRLHGEIGRISDI